MMKRIILAAAAGLIVFACSERGADLFAPLVQHSVVAGDSLFIVSGDGQSAGGSRQLANPLVLAVRNNGAAVAGATGTIVVTAGGGTVSKRQFTTNTAGEATFKWTLGASGPQQVTVTGRGLTTIVFTAIAVPAGSSLNVVSGSNQTARPGSTLGAPIVLSLRDPSGQAIEGVRVDFIASKVSGAVWKGATKKTAANGRVSNFVTLGWGTLVQPVTAFVAGVDTVVVNATADTAGMQFRIKSGDNQSAPRNQTLPLPLVVEVVDTGGHPVEGARGQWRVTSGGGKISRRTLSTNALGESSVTSRLGTNAVQKVTASIGVFGNVVFTSTAQPPVASIVVDPPSASIMPGTTQRFTALLRDSANSVAANRVVRWSSASAAVATIDSVTGIATAVSAGATTITARSEGVTATAQLHVQGAVRGVISAGAEHSCALNPSGQAYCWGLNASGQLGNNTFVSSTIPVAVAGNHTFKSISAGGSHTCAITTTNATYCWGLNANGQLGTGNTASQSTPALVSGTVTFATVSAGGAHTCAIADGGAGYCWGKNVEGQLGDDTNIDRSTPTSIYGSLLFKSISAGGAHTAAVTMAGGTYGWGLNTSRQVTNSTVLSFKRPVGHYSSGYKAASAGSVVSLFLTAEGRVQIMYGASGPALLQPTFPAFHFESVHATTGTSGWGLTSEGRLYSFSASNPTTTPNNNPTGTYVAFSTSSHSMTLNLDGTISSWGTNTQGQLGDGTVGGANTYRLVGYPFSPPARSIDVSGASSLYVGNTLQLFTVVRDGAAREVAGYPISWTSSNTGIASVSGTGVVSGVSGGTALIRASTGGVFDTMRVTVNVPSAVDSVAINPSVIGMIPGSTRQLSASAFDAARQVLPPQPVTWSTANATVASVNGSGLLTAGSAGTTTVSATIGGRTATVAVTVDNITSTMISANCALTGAGAAYCGISGTPVAVPGGMTFRSIASTSNHTCAIASGGAAYCWGANHFGQLGDGTFTARTTPTPVSGGRTFKVLIVGYSYTCGITDTGTYCWGQNLYGSLGDGTTVSRPVPTLVAGGHTFKSIAAGNNITCAITTSNAAYCWGHNMYGALGDGTNIDRSVPTAVAGGHAFRSIAVGNHIILAINTSGAGYAWGYNAGSALGDGTTTSRLTPVPIAGGLTFRSLAAGHNHSAGITTDGVLHAWGGNGQGHLGDGTTITRNAPVPVLGFSTVSEVIVSGQHSFAMTADGDVWRWGYGYSSPVSIGAPFAANPPVATTIVISPDRAEVSKDYTTMLTAVVRDQFGNPMSGQPLTWASLDTMRATVANNTNTYSFVLGKTLGPVTIRATSGSAMATAAVEVIPRATTVSMTPASPVVAIGDTVRIIATPRDASGNPLVGRSITWSSSNTAVATVSTSGLVTGHALGTATISANAVTAIGTTGVRVANTLKVSFGSDHFDVARFGQKEVPLTLSFAPSTPVTLMLSTSDTLKAKFTASKITVGAGQTSVNASIQGINIGNVTMIVRDSANTYGADTASARVQIVATIQIPPIELWNYRYQIMNTTDRYIGEIRLSDPAPPGGLPITFDGAGVVTPEPATLTIPEGQLSGIFAIRGLAPSTGQVFIRANAPGTATAAYPLTVYAPVFSFTHNQSPRKYTIGVGQRENSVIRSSPLNLRAPARTTTPGVVTITNGAPAVATLSATLDWTGDSLTFPIDVRGLAVGRVPVTASAANWTSVIDTIIVTRPKIVIQHSGFGTETQSTQGPGTMYVGLADSAGVGHPAADSVFFTVRSSDSTIIRVLTPQRVILPNLTYAQNIQLETVGAGGSVWLYTGGPGFITDSVRVIVHAPKLNISAGPYLTDQTQTFVTAGFQQNGPAAIQLPAYPTRPTVVKFTSTDTMVVAVDSVVLYNTSASLVMRSRNAGSATLIATSPGYSPDTITVHTRAGRLSSQAPYELIMFSSAQAGSYAYDSLMMAGLTTLVPRSFTLTILDPGIAHIDSTTITRLPGQAFQFNLPVRAVSAGQTKLIIATPGFKTDTVNVVVQPVSLTVSGYSRSEMQPAARTTANVGNVAVMIPRPREVPVTVAVTNRNPAVASPLVTTVTIPAGQTSAAIDWAAHSIGVDTLVFSATGYSDARWGLRVRAPKVYPPAIEPSMYTHQRASGNVYLGMVGTNGLGGLTTQAVTFRVTSSNPSVLQPDSTFVHIPIGSYQAIVPYRSVGAGQARLLYSDSAGTYAPDSTNITNVTAPPLAFSQARLKMGMRQMYGDSGVVNQNPLFITVPHAVTGTPLVVTLSSSDVGVATVPSTVTIPVGATRIAVRVTTHDQRGSISIYATATGYLQSRVDVDVSRPRLALYVQPTGVTGQKSGMYIDLQDSTGVQVQTKENIVVTLTSSNPAVAALDVTSVTLLAGRNRLDYLADVVRYVGPGTATITATDTRTGAVVYFPSSVNVTVSAAPSVVSGISPP